MQIWTGKIFLLLAFVALGGLFGAGCSSEPTKPATADEIEKEESLTEDQKKFAELRKDIPDEVKKSNDRLSEVLKRWKQQKMPPDQLRERFTDEIRKMREAMDKKHRRLREDFQKAHGKRRKEFQEKQKEERDSFFSRKQKQERRSEFHSDQSEERERFNSDLRDERDEFDDRLKDERKIFEDDVAQRWVEFRQEFPEYMRLYREMKEEEERKREEAKQNPTPYAGWPYDDTPKKPKGTPPEAVDVNKGGGGWPSSDPAEFDQMGGGGP